MYILVDGYNLLHAIGFHEPLSIPGNLERARRNTLDKLATYLTPEQCQKTIVIFDSGFRSRERPKQYEYRGIRVEFSFGFDDADSMIEGLIRKHQVPQKLLVVSSDHRIQNAARRRQSRFVDSDVWMDQLEHPARNRERDNPDPSKPTLSGDAEYWMNWFDAGEDEPWAETQTPPPTESVEDTAEEPDEKNSLGGDFDPFPEGYGEDLLD